MTNTAAQSQPPRANDSHDETPIEVQVAQLREAMNEMLRAGDGDRVVDTLLEIITQQQRDNARLARRVERLLRWRFGRRSEKLNAKEIEQLALAFGATPEQAAVPEPQVPQPDEPEENDAHGEAEAEKKPRKKGSKKGRHPGRSRLDPKLPRNVTFHPVPADERYCIHCQLEMQPAGHVDHERVRYVPARIEVDVDRCEKVACGNCKQDIAVAPRPDAKPTPKASQGSAKDADSTSSASATKQGEELITPRAGAAEAGPASGKVQNRSAKSQTLENTVAPGAHVYRRADASLLAHLLEAKGDDAMPIYRQRQQLARLGFDAPLNTLYGYWDAATRMVEPVADVVLSEVLGHSIVGLDDTRLDWLDPKANRIRRRGHLWCFMGTSPLVAFQFTETWCADDVAPWIESIDGFIQCDDYRGYSAMRQRDDGSVGPLVPSERRLGCWMHARRPFFDAFQAGERHAIIALGHIKELYAIEREAREANMAPPERLALRKDRSVPVAEEFFDWVLKQEGLARPSSYLGKAVGYAKQQKPFLLRCFEDGRFELDTGRIEREIKEPVIGRKNYLFTGSPEAAKRLAGVYTLICSCNNLGINTRAYLVDIIARLHAGFPLRHINRLRPDIWAQEHPSLVAQQMAQQADH
jgi:transposase